jgi:hypothetical protein
VRSNLGRRTGIERPMSIETRGGQGAAADGGRVTGVEMINCLGSPVVADGSRGGREGGSSVILMLTEDREVVR